MNRTRRRRSLIGVLLAGGCLLSGPCGITTLQLQDFVTSTFIRTGVTTLAGIIEAATIEAAQDQEGG